jgi:hypothetical protein
MQQTSIRVSVTTRDQLNAVAAEMGAASVDAALRIILFQRQALAAIERLERDSGTDAAAADEYRAEAAELAEVDVQVTDPAGPGDGAEAAR